MAYFDEGEGFGVDPNGNARRRSSISAFSADGRGNFSRTYAGPETGGEAQRQEWGADYDDALSQRQVYDGMEQLGRRAAAVKRHNANLGNATILSAMKIAQQNGGRFPAYALDSAMRNFGMDGKSQAIGGMGYTSNGDFVIDMLSAGPNGGVTRTPRVIKPREQYQMMLGGGGAIFNQQDTMAFRQSLMDKHGYAGNELPVPDFSGVAMGAQVRQSQAKNAGLDKMIDTVVQSAMKEGRDPRWEAARALLTNKDFRAGIHGKQRVGEDGKPLMTTDDNGNEVPDYEPATDDDVMKSVDAYLEHYLGPRGGNGGQDDWQARLAAADAILEKYYGPRKLSPEEQEIVRRQRQNAVEDQRRADNMRGPQQLVRYTDANGRLVTGNGWIRDGKVYDANGYEVQGATPMTARYDAATGETRYEEMPRPEPAAEAQGAQGGYDPALVASDGTIGPTVKAAQENLGAGDQPPAQDGAALLQQMRGGVQFPAQGATQPAQGGATAQPKTPEDKARAALAKRRGNAGGSTVTPNATQNGNATDRSGNGGNAAENPAPATRRLSNKHRLGLFKDSGGEYEENAGGFRTVTIGNYDYLSDEDRAANSKVARESKDADIDIDALLKLQEKANANKAEFDKKRLAEENAYRKSIASKNYTEKRMETEIQKHMEEWDEKNDTRIVNNRDVMNGGSGPIRLF